MCPETAQWVAAQANHWILPASDANRPAIEAQATS
jgi:hypothetical protein